MDGSLVAMQPGSQAARHPGNLPLFSDERFPFSHMSRKRLNASICIHHQDKSRRREIKSRKRDRPSVFLAPGLRPGARSQLAGRDRHLLGWPREHPTNFAVECSMRTSTCTAVHLAILHVRTCFGPDPAERLPSASASDCAAGGGGCVQKTLRHFRPTTFTFCNSTPNAVFRSSRPK